MAASTSITNFLSFFTPSKAPPPPKPSISHLSLSSDSPLPSLSSSSKNKDALVPLVASGDDYRPLSSSSEINQVINPGFAYANTLFFNSAYNVQVIVGENEPEEKLLGRFRREVMRAGIIQECKRRKFFENKQDKEKRKVRDAAKRNRRRRTFARPSFQDKAEEAATASKKEDDNDNWDLPEGNLPY